MNYIKDVSLYNTKDDTKNVVIEICPGTSDKNELIEPGFNNLKCVRQVEGVYPFYYGSFPQTYAGDKDPLDMILFTDKDHQLLDLVKVDVIGAIKTIDAGEIDDKIICVEADCDLKNVKKEMKKALKFLKKYKGKNADMVIEKRLASMDEAEGLLLKSHEAWKSHTHAINKNIIIKSNNTNNTYCKVRVIKD